jgi:hypothetical protein
MSLTDAEVKLDFELGSPIRYLEHHAKWVHIEDKLADKNRFGRIQSPSIKLRGLARPIDATNFHFENVWTP